MNNHPQNKSARKNKTPFYVSALLIILLSLGVCTFFFIHFYEVIEVISPTCDADGFTKEKCKICNKEQITNVTPQLTHIESEWVVDSEPTCTEEGSRHTICILCENTITQEKLRASHSYVISSLLSEGNCEGTYTCSKCDYAYKAPLSSKEIGLPVLNIIGNLTEISKENTVNVVAEYDNNGQLICSDATLKWQGATSLNWEKKNYTIKFVDSEGNKNKLLFKEEWGKQNKYCLKANYIDYSQARNLVSAKLFGDIVHSRNKDDELDSLINGGAVDGFPICLYINGSFAGLYTMNIPKDGWLFGMKKSEEKRAMIFQASWSDSGRLVTPIINPTEEGWSIEYCSTDDESWVYDSFNDFINFLQEPESVIRENINKYTDVDRIIDAMLWTQFINGADNFSKNLIWVTFDGTKWYPSLYDMDSTWSLDWVGELSDIFWGSPAIGTNMAYAVILMYYRDLFDSRLDELRQNILTEEYLYSAFADFMNAIPDYVYASDLERWPDIPSADTNNLQFFEWYIPNRISYIDS